MTGFKNFILRGNLVELAVALIMALAFTAIVTATVDLIMGLIGKVGPARLLRLDAWRAALRRLGHGSHQLP